MSTPNFCFPHIELQETDSTSCYLQRLLLEQADKVDEFTTITAQFQHAGKGQRGNSWEAKVGKNLLFSFVLYPTFLQAEQQFILSQLVSLSIATTLERYVDSVTVKWPNDIYWQEKKICGILIEHELCGSTLQRTICGIGLNINQEKFESNAPNPISLRQICGRSFNIDTLLQQIMQSIYDGYMELKSMGYKKFSHNISKQYATMLFRNQGYHRYKDTNGEFLAKVNRVDEDGRFFLEDEAGVVRSYLFKEVQYLL